jgi:hypothetical protein
MRASHNLGASRDCSFAMGAKRSSRTWQSGRLSFVQCGRERGPCPDAPLTTKGEPPLGALRDSLSSVCVLAHACDETGETPDAGGET